MKNIYRIILVSITLLLTASSINGYATEKGDQGNRPSHEELQLQKIAFYSSELKLTTKEAEKFWPLYNEFWEERGKAHKTTMAAFKKIEESCNNNASDQEIKRYAQEYLDSFSKEAELPKQYFSKFLEILPVEKAAKVFLTEEKFRRMLIKQLRHGDKQHPAGKTEKGKE